MYVTYCGDAVSICENGGVAAKREEQAHGTQVSTLIGKKVKM
jgi:hypothetical protein